ncbi:hypothetical protein CPB83DRAFT_844294 [Crepidotus variabilis]|uniref:RING-type domain-containing protein n=1 Tax=Crepidotus variabilis TaxID=179855 RepID=A0A9P6JWE7_9AGAR|nr:hypothetical protein CPB83DRAFT_844294 [Crepidotus variabilis]
MSQDVSSIAQLENRPLDFGSTVPTPSSSSSSLKRRASSSFDCSDDSTRKRLKETKACTTEKIPDVDSTACGMDVDGAKLVDEIMDELQCGCCSELVYRPVLVIPCQHYFCGSCCLLWIRNGGTSCPVCRTMATVGMPFRAIQPLIDSLLRTAPHKARTQRERQQADEVYKAGQTIRFPPPREASPAPETERSADYIHPCPHCAVNNPYDWRCPQPLPDPATDADNAWHVDDGVPPGHAHCGNCENLMAIRAPSSSRCDFCNTCFCGIGVQDRCVALPLLSQHPHNLSSHSDLILSADVYECFDGNTVEVEIMLEYVDAQNLTPRHIYRDIIMNIQKSPRGFQPLVDLDLFSDLHAVSPSRDGQSEGARNRACRLCAAEIFLWGLKDWWLRERKKGFVEPNIMSRKDCPEGRMCNRQQNDHGHAREYNHVFASAAPTVAPENLTDPQFGEASTSHHPLSTTPPGSPQRVTAFTPARLTSSSSAASLSFLLNAEDIGGQSTPHRRATPMDIREALEGFP